MCATDGDCAVTGFAGCCAACAEAPYAINRAALQRETDVCTVVECACAGDCTHPRCRAVADPGAFRAACVAGRCAAVKR
ncbi:MAG TPA: hypothetical protein VKZ18_11480 [Polyangia bacterium]|nr:hypothetical protein [Polyangia bacterium]